MSRTPTTRMSADHPKATPPPSSSRRGRRVWPTPCRCTRRLAGTAPPWGPRLWWRSPLRWWGRARGWRRRWWAVRRRVVGAAGLARSSTPPKGAPITNGRTTTRAGGASSAASRGARRRSPARPCWVERASQGHGPRSTRRPRARRRPPGGRLSAARRPRRWQKRRRERPSRRRSAHRAPQDGRGAEAGRHQAHSGAAAGFLTKFKPGGVRVLHNADVEHVQSLSPDTMVDYQITRSGFAAAPRTYRSTLG